MSKIYLLRHKLSDIQIIEVELLKQTPEQLRVDPMTAKAVWKSKPDASTHYLSSRLQRHRETYFTELNPAIQAAAEKINNNLKNAEHNVTVAKEQLIYLFVFAKAQGVPDAS